MQISEREIGDQHKLKLMAHKEKDAEQRDRYRAALMAIQEQEAPVIAAALDRSRRFVQRWAYAYRDGGVEALKDKPRGGSKPKFPHARAAELKARLDAGPRPEDGVCTLRGKDVRSILEREFGVKVSLNGAYRTLYRLGYSCLVPRPRHEKQDQQAQEKFRKSAPLLSRR
jgi:transposase